MKADFFLTPTALAPMQVYSLLKKNCSICRGGRATAWSHAHRVQIPIF